MKKIELKLQVGLIAPYSATHTRLFLYDLDLPSIKNVKSIATVIVKKFDLSKSVKVGTKLTLTISQ